MNATISGALDDTASRWPRREALVIGSERITFAALADQSRTVATGLLRAGLGPGVRVGLLLHGGLRWAITFLAIVRAGAVAVPLNPKWTLAELSGVLSQAKLAGLIVGSTFRGVDFRHLAAQALREIPTGSTPQLLESAELATHEQDASSSARLRHIQDQARWEDVSVIQFTSGSTSFPKGAMLRQGALLDYVRDYGALMGVTPEDRVLCHMPFFHIGGLNHVLFVPLAQGATAIAADSFDPQLALDQLQRERCTVFGGISTMYLRMAEVAPDPVAAFAGVRSAWIQGSGRSVRRVHEITRIRGLTSHYGSTEMSGATTFGNIADPLEIRLSTAGRTMPGIETRIVDPASGEDCAPGVAGEIWQRGRRQMAGYLGLSREAWNIDAEGWFHTGDLGSLDGHGYLTFEGRLKDMVKVGGENVACVEVEDVLLAHPAVRMAAVVGVPDDDLDEVPIAFIELAHASDETALIAHCRTALARFKVPRQILFVDRMPMTGSNKIHKPELARMARAQRAATEIKEAGR